MKNTILFLLFFIHSLSAQELFINDFASSELAYNIDTADGELKLAGYNLSGINLAALGNTSLKFSTKNFFAFPVSNLYNQNGFVSFGSLNNGQKPGSYIIVDLFNVKNIDSLTFNFFSPQLTPPKFSIYAGDDSLSLQLIRSEYNPPVNYKLLLNSFSARFFKITIDSLRQDVQVAIKEFGIFGNDSAFRGKYISKIYNSDAFRKFYRFESLNNILAGASAKFRIAGGNSYYEQYSAWFPFSEYMNVVSSLNVSYPLIKYFRFEILLESTSPGLSPQIDWIKFLYEKMNYPGWENLDSTNSPLSDAHGITSIEFGNGDDLFVSTYGGGLLKYSNGLWSVYNTTNSNIPSNYIWQVKIALNGEIWLRTSLGLTKYDGYNWTLYSYSSSGYNISEPNDFEIDDQNNVWLGTSFSGLFKLSGGLWSNYPKMDSLNTFGSIKNIAFYNGRTWISHYKDLPLISGVNDQNVITYSPNNSPLFFTEINDIKESPNGGLWVINKQNTFPYYILKYKDGHWEKVYLQLDYFYNYKEILEEPDGNLWLLDWGSIHNFKNNTIIKYDSTNSNLPNAYLGNNLLLNNGKLYTYYGSTIVIFDLNYTLFMDDNRITVNNLSLSQNYPNPFNAQTKIRYTVPSSEHVTLKIYNILGQEAAQLVNEFKTAGSYEVDFNASSLSSGVYLYRLSTGQYSETKKLLLLK